MKRIKADNPYKPEVTLEQILAYEKGKPETYTCSGLVNAVCDQFADNKVLAAGQVAERLGLDSKHLAYALQVLTGHNTSSIRAELVADRWRKHKRQYPHDTGENMAHRLGFADGSALIKFMERNRRRFPELYLHEEEQYNQMAEIVEEVMPQESAAVRRVFIRLPYQGSQEEKEACLRLLYRHARHVADLAVSIARSHPGLTISQREAESCALLHNVGIVHTDMPELHCHGKKPYVMHGEEGFNILCRYKNLDMAPFSAQMHIGAGITFEEVQEKHLPISPVRPEWAVTKLVCYASSFYSIFEPDRKRTVDEIRRTLAQYGAAAVARFDKLHQMFG